MTGVGIRKGKAMSESESVTASSTGFVAKDHYSLEELDRFSQFGPGDGHSWPRLPQGKMRLFHRVSQIKRLDEGGVVRVLAQYGISPGLWFFEDHFSIMPGALLQDALHQMVGFAGAWLGYRGMGMAFGVDRIRFKSSVTPSVRIVHYAVTIDRVKQSQGTVFITGSGTAYADKDVAATAEGLSVVIKSA